MFRIRKFKDKEPSHLHRSVSVFFPFTCTVIPIKPTHQPGHLSLSVSLILIISLSFSFNLFLPSHSISLILLQSLSSSIPHSLSISHALPTLPTFSPLSLTHMMTNVHNIVINYITLAYNAFQCRPCILSKCPEEKKHN